MGRMGAKRSKGCNTCRRRRVKCDERRPSCNRCHMSGHKCEGYVREHRFVDEVPRTIQQSQKQQDSASASVAQQSSAESSCSPTPSSSVTAASDDNPSENESLQLTRSISVDSPAVDAFFHFVGDKLSPVTVAFTKTAILPFLSDPIYRVVEAIGIVRIQLPPNGVHNRDMVVSMRGELRPYLESLLVLDGNQLSHSTLLFAMLLAIFELMTDETGFGFIVLMTKLTKHALAERSRIAYETTQITAERSLQIFYRIMEANRALNLHENSPLAGAMPRRRVNSKPSSPMERDFVMYEQFCAVMLAIVQTNVRSRRWSEEARLTIGLSCNDGYSADDAKAVLWSPEHAQFLASGRTLMHEAIQWINFVRSLPQFPTSELFDPAQFATLSPAFFAAGRIAITRLFVDPIWSAVYPGLDLPGAEELQHMEEHTQSILNSIEARLLAVDLEAALFCPLVYSASLEARDKSSRARVTRLYEMMAVKGFIVSTTYLSDIQLAWEMIPVAEERVTHTKH